MKRALLTTLTLAALLAAPRPAAADTEWVLVLDTSNSMDDGATDLATNAPIDPNDPDRLAVIATLIFRALMGPDDKLTILAFDMSRSGIFRTIPNDPDKIRTIDFDGSTFVIGPLREARRILDASTAKTKILLLATDGAPSAEPPAAAAITPDEARQLLGLDPGPASFQVVSLALSRTAAYRPSMEAFLGPLGRLESIEEPDQLVAAFTDVFADSIRSRPETGRLASGGNYKFPVGKYVTDVYVALATEKKTGPFAATLLADGKPITAVDAGDSGCKPPCGVPCYAYQVFRTKRDPSSSSTFELSLPDRAGAAVYGIVLRYELGAEIVSAPAKVKVGAQMDVVARLDWQGSTFNDPAFFKSDGFTATLTLGDQTVPLTVGDDGTFTAKVTVSGMPGPARMVATFANQWISLEATRDLTIEEWVPLDLVVAPLDFGSWTGGRDDSKRCVDLDFAGSLNADKVPIEAIVEGLGAGYRVEVESPLTIVDGKARICLVAPGCCSASKPGATLTVRGIDPHFHPGAIVVPMTYQVAPTPFLTCWWPYIAAAIGTILLVIIVLGFVRPRDFDREEVIRLAKTEQALSRAGGRRLRDLPGGKRGFYRDARIALDGTGNAIRGAKGASIVLRAAKGDPHVTVHGGLEEKDARTRKFVAVDLAKGPVYLRRGIIYRSGEFFFRVG